MDSEETDRIKLRDQIAGLSRFLTKARFSASQQDGKPGHCVMAQVFSNGVAFVQLEPSHDPAYASGAAELIALLLNRQESIESALSQAATIVDLQHKLWLLASHATGGSLGALPMEQVCAMTTHDVAVQISAFRTKLWNDAKAKSAPESERLGMEKAARIADNHVVTADDDVQQTYSQAAIDIAAAIRSAI